VHLRSLLHCKKPDQVSVDCIIGGAENKCESGGTENRPKEPTQVIYKIGLFRTCNWRYVEPPGRNTNLGKGARPRVFKKPASRIYKYWRLPFLSREK